MARRIGTMITEGEDLRAVKTGGRSWVVRRWNGNRWELIGWTTTETDARRILKKHGDARR